jgi:arylsulfatase A-like enzyme
VSCMGAGCAPAPSGPPNIVLVLVDTLRRDHLSVYGADVATPTLQALADRGQVFTRVQASYHQTTMSMGALFTGRTPSLESGDLAEPLRWEGHQWCGMRRFAQGPDDSCVPQGMTTLAEALHDAGYWTAGVVGNRLLFRPAGYDQGFDSWSEVSAGRADLPTSQLAAARSAPHINDRLKEVLESRPTDRPAFVYVHFLDAHDYQARSEEYSQAIERFDREFARTLQILDDAGLGDDSVLFFLSDHGESLGEVHLGKAFHNHFGNPSYQAVLDIPLIVVPPLVADPSAWIRTIDVNGLIRGVAGLPTEAEDEAVSPDELFVSERDYVTYRKGRYKTSFHRRKMGKWQLYDLESDPGETTNIISVEKEIGLAHLARVQQIAERVAATDRGSEELSEEDAEALRALGYLK